MKMAYLLLSLSLLGNLMSNLAIAKEYKVEMLNNSEEYGMMVFSPPVLQVEVGDTIRFVPTDSGHNVMTEIGPEKGDEWRSESGQEFVVTVETEGVYIYTCTPHKVMAMVGVIQVGKAVNLEDATEKAKALSATFALNKERLTDYLTQLASSNSKSQPDNEKTKAMTMDVKEESLVESEKISASKTLINND